MSTVLALDGLRGLLVLAAVAAVGDVWWQTSAHERRAKAEARRLRRVRALSELEPPSEDKIRAEVDAAERLRLERALRGGREPGDPPSKKDGGHT